MTDEERKARGREKMRRYRLRHANDPAYKERVRNEKKRQWARNPERHKEGNERRRKRYVEKHKDSPSFKQKAADVTRKWCENNAERANASRAAWLAANREKVLADHKRWRTENAERVRRAGREYAETHADELRAYRKAKRQRVMSTPNLHEKLKEYMRPVAAQRRAQKLRAMPRWADKNRIADIYSLAQRKTDDTGHPWHVDHIVPLQHKFVCGLHVPANLQILPDLENKRKSNRFEI